MLSMPGLGTCFLNFFVLKTQADIKTRLTYSMQYMYYMLHARHMLASAMLLCYKYVHLR